jgi:hypothetical protein
MPVHNKTRTVNLVRHIRKPLQLIMSKKSTDSKAVIFIFKRYHKKGLLVAVKCCISFTHHCGIYTLNQVAMS